MTPRTAALLFAVIAFPVAAADPPPAPADLRVSWMDRGDALVASAGQTLNVPYLLSNVGGRNAFAVVVRIRTTLGPVAPPLRMQPGPNAGQSLASQFALAAASGMREVCVDVQLQNVSAEDPADPNPGDNRVCRPVQVK